MKIAGPQIDRLLRDPAGVTIILLHGDDWGLVRDRSSAAIRSVLGAERDSFRLAILAREEHGRLADEVQSRSLSAGRKVIVVPDAAESLAGVLDFVGDQARDVLVILQSAALGPKSKLRLMAEKRPDCAAIACYPERSVAIAAGITQMTKAGGQTITPDALAFLTTELAGDTGRRRGELEKLQLYALGQTQITRELAEACCSVEADATVGAVVAAALSGRRDACDRLLDELSCSGTSGVGLLVLLGMQVQRLLKLRSQVDDGIPFEVAVLSLRPPIYSSQIDSISADMRLWPQGALVELGRAIQDADVACKRARSADVAIAAQLLTAVARRAASGSAVA